MTRTVTDAAIPAGAGFRRQGQLRAWRMPLLVVVCCIVALLAGCGSSGRKGGKGGGYYLDDGPGSDIPANIQNIPDAVPRIEPHNPANFRPYKVMGQQFVPVSASTQLRQRGVASWYGRKFHGQKTANGETYNMYAMSAAHPTLPLPSYARVTHEASGRSVIVRVNDRGPFLRGRVIDLSYAAAAKLGIIGKGSDRVVVEAITHADIRRGLNMASAPKPAAPAPAVQTAAAPAPAVRTAPAPAVRTVAAPTPAVHTVAASAPATRTPVGESTALETPDVMAALAQRPPETESQAELQPQPQPQRELEPQRTPTPSVTSEPSGGIYLQFGAFASYPSADRLANQLNAEIAQVEGRNAHISSGDDLHRVRIGPYESRTAAVNAAVRIQEATGMQPTLAQR